MPRPRTSSFSEEEFIQLGQEMVNWVIENDPIHLSQWYSGVKKFIYKDWKTFIQRDEFIPYYDQALKIVGLKYLLKDSPIEPSLKQRWQRVYYADLKDQEDQDKKDDLAREAEMQRGVSHDYEQKLGSMLDQLKRARQSVENEPGERNES